MVCGIYSPPMWNNHFGSLSEVHKTAHPWLTDYNEERRWPLLFKYLIDEET